MRRRLLVLGVTLVVGAALAFAALTALRTYGAPGIEGCRFVTDFSRRADCAGHRAADLIREHGLLQAQPKIDRVWGRHTALAFVCHNAAHVAAFDTYEGSTEQFDAAAKLPPGCLAAGYRHGTMEMAVRREPAKGLKRVAAYCRKVATANREECFHGMGHGFHRRFGVGPGLKRCDAMGGPQRDYVSCYTGVFMSDVNARDDDPATRRDPQQPCPEVRNVEAQQACHGLTPARALQSGTSLLGVTRICKGVAGENNQRACYYGLGGLSVIWTPRKRPAGRLAICGKLDAGVPVRFCLLGLFATRMFELDVLPEEVVAACGYLAASKGVDCAEAVGATLELGHGLGIRGTSASCSSVFKAALVEACERGREPVPGLVTLASAP